MLRNSQKRYRKSYHIILQKSMRGLRRYGTFMGWEIQYAIHRPPGRLWRFMFIGILVTMFCGIWGIFRMHQDLRSRVQSHGFLVQQFQRNQQSLQRRLSKAVRYQKAEALIIKQSRRKSLYTIAEAFECTVKEEALQKMLQISLDCDGTDRIEWSELFHYLMIDEARRSLLESGAKSQETVSYHWVEFPTQLVARITEKTE